MHQLVFPLVFSLTLSGWYEYSLPDTPLPLVPRCCALFSTLGNRRLADHVLTGIERLVALSRVRIGADFIASAQKLLARFPTSRLDQSDSDTKHASNVESVMPTWAAALLSEDSEGEGLVDGTKWDDISLSVSTFVSCVCVERTCCSLTFIDAKGSLQILQCDDVRDCIRPFCKRLCTAGSCLCSVPSGFHFLL